MNPLAQIALRILAGKFQNPSPLTSVAQGIANGGAFRNLHPEDAQVAEQFIDNTRLKQPPDQNLELAASRVAEHYGLPMPKTNIGLANVFDKVLTQMRERNKQVNPIFTK